MARAASTKKRRRGWAWTLTITSASLAVVWVGSMKMTVGARTTECQLHFSAGALNFVHITQFPMATETWIEVHGGWMAYWWFEHMEEALSPTTCKIISWRIPLWPFILLTGVPGAWMLVKTRKPTNPHACPACGYDRTGLPQTSTGPAPCPECGKGKDDDAAT